MTEHDMNEPDYDERMPPGSPDDEGGLLPMDDGSSDAGPQPRPAAAGLRRTLLADERKIKTVLGELRAINVKPTTAQVSNGAAIALACAYLDRDYPPADPDALPSDIVMAAADGRLNTEAEFATDLVEIALATIGSGKVSLALIYAMGIPPDPSWSNLQGFFLAQRLNAEGHSLMRTIPGWDA